MYKIVSIFFAAILFYGCHSTKVNTMTSSQSTSSVALSQQEKEQGWKLLFDGHSLNGWHGYGRTDVPKAWKAEGGVLHLDAASKKSYSTNEGGDIVTNEDFDNFDLKLEWKISPKGNSGIIFYVKEDKAKYSESYMTGPEMQVLDNERHPDSKIIKHRAGDLYDLITSNPETVKPALEWNHVEIISKDGNLELYLNGSKVVQTTLWNDAWKKLVAGSKFKDMPDFGKFKSGHIGLQDHGNKVWYRNIKIKNL